MDRRFGMLIKNGLVFFKEGCFRRADVKVVENKIASVAEGIPDDGEVIDAENMYVVPGFVDLHIHGAAGSDCCDGSAAALDVISGYLARQGVTSFCAATMSFDERTLTRAAECVKERIRNAPAGHAGIRGINMEGPFISPGKAGAQNPKYIIRPDYDMFHRINTASGNKIRIVDVAPEVDGMEDFIKKASRECVVSIAHTTADYLTCLKAFGNGASHVTHLYNAMPPFLHREPGVIGAAMEKAKYVELICDGVHVHPSVIRATFRLFPERICLISDSMKACGLADGEYSLGGQPVFVKNGLATHKNGTLAGSTVSLAECVRRAVGFGVTLEEVLRSSTINPARAIGGEGTFGSIECGAEADLLLLDHKLVPQTIIINGAVLD